MIKKQFPGETLKDGLKAKARDRLYTFMLAEDTVRGAFVHGTRMIKEMRASFDLGILETLALGHAYLGAGLMSSNLKGNDRLGMRIECSGPIKGISVETNAFGEVRGFLKNVPIPVEKPLKDFNLTPFFGAGFLFITKYLEDLKQPYTGQTELRYGTIAKDLAHYFYSSEQTPTVFNLSISFDKEGGVRGAGGLFMQVMPGVSEEIIEGLENAVVDMPSLGDMAAENMDPENIINSEFETFGPRILDSYRVEFFCRCSDRLIGDYISMLPLEELLDMAEQGPFPVEVRCHNCNTLYSFSQEQMDEMVNPHLS